jgi:large-conductance mechanosensitive channel
MEFIRNAYSYAKEKCVGVKNFVVKHGREALGIGTVTAALYGVSEACGTAHAEEIVLPTNPLDMSGLCTAAFSAFGEIITTVFPYVLVLAAVYLGMKLVKRLAKGSA